MSSKRLLPFVFLSASALAATDAYLSLTVISGVSPGTQVATTKCRVPLVSDEHIAKVKAAAEGTEFSVLEPGAVVPDIQYLAYYQGRKIILETHNERNTVINKSKSAQELQNLLFELCHE